MDINVRKVEKVVTLSQQSRVKEGKLTVSAHGAPVPFSRTLAASVTADYFFEVGKGSVDPGAYSKLFLQYAYDKGFRVEQLAQEFYEYVGAASKNSALWRTIASFITGSANRLIGADKLAQVPPEIVYQEIAKLHPSSHDLFVYALTDTVVGVLAPLGLVYGDVRFVYRISRTPTYPDFTALVDVVATRQLKHVLTSLADVDVSVLKKQMSEKKALNPSMLASVLNQAMHVSWERSRGNYAASDVTVAVLSACGKSWDMSLSGGAELTTRVRNAAGFEELHTNLGLFLAYQDMLALARVTPGAATMSGAMFPDEEMASTIIPLFREALTEVSPFVIRPIADCVSMVGLTTSRRHDQFPALGVLYEDWAAPEEMVAFVPVRLSHKGNERFLDTDDRITERLSMGMAPAVKQFGVPEFAKARRATHELAPAHSRLGKDGTVIVLGLPSLTEREIAAGRSASAAYEYIKTGVAHDANGDVVDVTRSQEWLAFSAYAHMVHIAVARTLTGRIEVAGVVGAKTSVNGANPLFLRWVIPTQFKEAVGTGAVLAGEVVVVEPIEAIAYSDDFAPSTKMSVSAPPLREFAGSVHIWDFMSAASEVQYVSSYVTNLRNKTYVATISEKEILGFGAARPRLHALRSPVARAIVSMWREWFASDLAYVRAGKGGKDSIQKAVYEGAELSIALDVLTRLVNLGSQGLGANVAAAVQGQLRDQLVGAGHIDDTSDLAVGVQQTSIAMYAGLVTLELLGLMDVQESAEIMSVIRDTRAMSTWVAANSSRR